MKKYKVYFSIFNLFNDTQAEVVKLQTYIKTLTGVASGTTWYATNANGALYVAFCGFILDALLSCLYFEEVKK